MARVNPSCSTSCAKRSWIRAAIEWPGSALPSTTNKNPSAPSRSTESLTGISTTRRLPGRIPSVDAAPPEPRRERAPYRFPGRSAPILECSPGARKRSGAATLLRSHCHWSAGPDTFGVLSIYSSEKNAFDEEEVVLLKELAADLSFGILTHRSNLQRRRAEARVERLANFDPLTELPNRVQLILHLEEAIRREGSGSEARRRCADDLERRSIQRNSGGRGHCGSRRSVEERWPLRLAGAVEAGSFVARMCG